MITLVLIISKTLFLIFLYSSTLYSEYLSLIKINGLSAYKLSYLISSLFSMDIKEQLKFINHSE